MQMLTAKMAAKGSVRAEEADAPPGFRGGVEQPGLLGRRISPRCCWPRTIRRLRRLQAVHQLRSRSSSLAWIYSKDSQAVKERYRTLPEGLAGGAPAYSLRADAGDAHHSGTCPTTTRSSQKIFLELIDGQPRRRRKKCAPFSSHIRPLLRRRRSPSSVPRAKRGEAKIKERYFEEEEEEEDWKRKTIWMILAATKRKRIWACQTRSRRRGRRKRNRRRGSRRGRRGRRDGAEEGKEGRSEAPKGR